MVRSRGEQMYVQDNLLYKFPSMDRSLSFFNNYFVLLFYNSLFYLNFIEQPPLPQNSMLPPCLN